MGICTSCDTDTYGDPIHSNNHCGYNNQKSRIECCNDKGCDPYGGSFYEITPQTTFTEYNQKNQYQNSRYDYQPSLYNNPPPYNPNY